MKRYKKKLWILIFTLLGIFSLTACGARRADLSVPTNVVLDEREVLTWNPVENAVRYEVDVNGISYRTETESLDLFERIVQPGDYEIRVCAYGEKGVAPSDWSEVVNYTLNSPQELIAFSECEGGYEISAVKPWKIKGKLVIPEAVGGVPVARVYESGFSGCTEMTGLILPNTVSEIGSRAFYGCTSLKRIRLSESIETLNELQFNCCSALTQVDFPVGMKYVGNAFKYCTSLKKVSFPDTVEEIRVSELTGLPNLSEISVAEGNPVFYGENHCVIRKSDRMLVLGGNSSVIPDGVMGIEEKAFDGRESLTAVSLPDSVESIGDRAFVGTGLSEITLPAKTVALAGSAFCSCDHLKKIVVASDNPVYRSEGNCVIRRSDRVLIVGCLDSVIPEGVTGIGECAFQGAAIREITLPDTVTRIEKFAFSSCFWLEKIGLSRNLTEIGTAAFNLCVSLSEVYLPIGLKTIRWGAFDGCYQLRSVVIPDSVETIGRDAFTYCTFYYPHTVKPEGWAKENESAYSGEIFGYWNEWSCEFKGCTLAYDGSFPYVESLIWEGFIEVVGDSEGMYYFPRVPQRFGYVFGGWATDADGTEIVCKTSVVHSTIDKNMAPTIPWTLEFDSSVSLTFDERSEISCGTVLYAVWIPLD